MLARVHPAPPRARGGAHGGHGQRGARPRPGRSDRAARARLCRPTSSWSTAADWRYLAYASEATSSADGGQRRPARGIGANLALAMPTRKQRRRREKNFRHEYETVLLDADGNERPLDDEEMRAERDARAQAKAEAKPAARKRERRSSAAVAGRSARSLPPSWQRALRRGGLMGGLMLVVFVFLFKNAPIADEARVGSVLCGRLHPAHLLGRPHGVSRVPATPREAGSGAEEVISCRGSGLRRATVRARAAPAPRRGS